MMSAQSFEVSTRQSKTIIDLPFCLFVVALTFLNKYLVWLCLCFGLILGIMLRCSIRNYMKMPGRSVYAVLVLQCVFVGIIEMIQGNTAVWPFSRDIISISLIPLYWIAGQYFLSRFTIRKVNFLYNFVISCAIISVLRLFGSVIDLASGNLSVYRVDEWLISISTFFIICHNRAVFGKRNKINICVSIVIILEFILGFSRTSIIILALLLCARILLHPKLLIRVVILVIGAISIASFGFRDQFQELTRKFVRSLTEVSSNDIWNADQITWNWRGFEVYCAKVKFRNGTLIQKIFGWGFGSEINSFGYSHLVTSEDTLPYLHNGYYTMLIKGGFLGLLLLFLFYIVLLTYIYRKYRKLDDVLLSTSLIAAMLVTMYVISGLFVNPSFYWLLFWGFCCRENNSRGGVID